MRLLPGSTAPLALVMLMIGCNTVSPDQCYPNTTGGFGGSGAIPIGAGVGVTSGDFGSPPQSGPLDYTDPPNPCIEPATPCLGKCLADYEFTAAECGRIANETQRKTCQDGAYEAYRSCANSCHQADNEKCKQACDKVYNKCMDKCKDSNCRKECLNDYVPCLKECDK
jgi:hypothetical protein